MWPWTAILGEATVSVGVAAAAVDAAVQLCRTKTPAYNATPLREQQLAQFQMGKARARVEASRDTLYRAAEAAYDDVVRSSCPPLVRRQDSPAARGVFRRGSLR